MSETVPTNAEMQAYLEANKNWGRWGPEDERGALNYITPERVAKAAQAVRTGRQAFAISQ